jgi:uncharacterized protein
MTELTIDAALRRKILIGLVAYIILSVLEMFFGWHIVSAGRYFISKLISWTTFLLVYVYVERIEKQPFLYWQERSYSFWRYCLLFVGLLIVNRLAGIGVELLLRALHLYKNSRLADIKIDIFKQNTALMLFGCLTAGITEELIFRGYVQTRLQTLYNKTWLSVLVPTLLFTFGHLGYGTLVNMAVPFVTGLIFALFYWRYRNIKILISCHFMFDLWVDLHNIHLPVVVHH